MNHFQVMAVEEEYILPIILIVLFLAIFISISLHRFFKLRRKITKVEGALDELEKNDPLWTKKHLEAFVEIYTTDLMKAWSTKDREQLRTLLSEGLYMRRVEMIDRMDAVKQVNVIDDLRVQDIQFVDVKDYTDDSLDRFTARIRYNAVNFTMNYRDKWEEPEWGEDIDSNPEMESREYIEFWTFLRHDATWKLARVEKEWKEGNYTDTEPVLKDEKYMKIEDI